MQSQDAPIDVVVVMGVSGSGKTSIASALASELGWAFAEGDRFHSESNLAKMASGTPLVDDDRWPWLDSIAAWIREQTAAGRSVVVACSALKRRYRDRLRQAWPALRVVYLFGDRALLEQRLGERKGHFFPKGLLDSQLADLEPPGRDEQPIVVDVAESLPAIVARATAALRAGAGF
jgi:gluconokinase